MGMYGKIFKVAGKVVGFTGKHVIKGTGHIMSAVFDVAGVNSNVGNTIRGYSNFIGCGVDGASKIAGSIAGETADIAFEGISELGGIVCAGIADASGAEDRTIEKAHKAGKVAMGVVTGVVVGDVLGSAVSGVAATAGVAGTGTAINTLSGAAQNSATLALLGGGSLATGGGGMQAGAALLTGINTASAAGGGIQAYASSTHKNKIEDESKESIKQERNNNMNENHTNHEEMENTEEVMEDMNNNTNDTGNNVKRDAASDDRINDIAAQWFNRFADMGANIMHCVGTNINKHLEVYGDEVVPDVKEKTSEAWKEVQDEKIAGNVSKVYDALMNIRKLSCTAYRKLLRLYEANGWVRTSEIKMIIEASLDEAIFTCLPSSKKTKAEYIAEGNKLMAAMAGLRDCIKKAGRKMKELLGVDVKGTIANKVYAILKRVGSLLLFGGKVVISVGMWVFAAIASFAIFIAGTAFAAVSWVFLYIKGAILNGKKPAASEAIDTYEDDDIEMEEWYKNNPNLAFE